MIKNYFELSRVSSLSQQILGKHLALLRQLLIVIPTARELDAISVHKCFRGLSITINIFVCTCRHNVWIVSLMVNMGDGWSQFSPEFHLYKAELLQVCTELKRSENRVLLGKHDERRTCQAAVDVKAEPVKKNIEQKEERGYRQSK